MDPRKKSDFWKMDFSNSNKNGSVRKTPAGINSLKEIKMVTLSKFIGKLKLTSANEFLENQNYINLLFEIDQEYTIMQSKNADLEKRLEESITASKGDTDQDKQATFEESKNTFEKKYEKLKSSYEIHLRRCGEKMQEYQYAMERLNCKIDNDHQEIQRYKENKIKLQEEVYDLKLILSQVAGSKISGNNLLITDLNDPNRPQKIAEHFSELYDNEWTDALEMLQKSGKSERVAIDTLLNTLKVCFEYCQEQSENQQKNIANALLPTQSHDLGIFTSEVAKSVNDLRKMTDIEDHWVTWLNQEFLKTEEYNSLVEERKEELFINFVNVCLKCGWLSNVQDPPVVLDFNLEQFSKFDSSYTKVFTKPGDFVDFVVWPCMLRNTCGVLLSKGVVQCTKDGGPKTLPPPFTQF